MGVDVYGENPSEKVGEYFRNNRWWWRPLAEYCCLVAPEVTQHCEYWQSNDGDGLDETQSVLLAQKLREEVAAGRTRKYAADRAVYLDGLPLEPCEICDGTGRRELGECNGCEGVGKKRRYETMYPFVVENVEAFAEFLENCGGFKIC